MKHPGTEPDPSRELPPVDPVEDRLGALDRSQPFMLLASIAVGLGLARVMPVFADSLLPVVSIGVFVLIYLVMLNVNFSGVLGAFTNRTFLITAVALNFIVNPLLAWVLSATFLRSEPDLWVGLILFLVTPCVGWYLIFTEMADGDTRLGVSLLGLNVVLQVLLLPLYLLVFAGRVVAIDLATIGESIAVFLIAPLMAATLTRKAVGRTRHSLEAIQERAGAPYIKAGVLGVVIISMFASQADELFANPGVVFKLVAPVSVFFAVAFATAVAVGHKLNLPYNQTALLAFTTTSRNSEASLAIAATAFTSPLVPLTVVIGPIIELPLLIIMVRFLASLRPTLEKQPRTNSEQRTKAGQA